MSPRPWRRFAGHRAPVVHRPDAAAISVENVSVVYGGRPALAGISFVLEAGEYLAVVGPNGAGKSTLLKALAGLLPTSSGTIAIHGHEPGGHVCIAYVPQRSEIDWRFPVAVADVVMMGRIGRIGPFRRAGTSDWDIVRRALSAVQLDGLAGRQVGELSGGQQQRMFIARALAQESDLLLFDEPLAGLDIASRDEVLALIGALRERAVTVVVALHDLAVAASAFDRVLLLHRTQIGFGSAERVFDEPLLRSAYGSCLRTIERDGRTVFIHDAGCDGGDHEPR